MKETARIIFFKRLRSDFQNLWKANKLVMDWTLFVYLLIPGAATAAFFYMEWLGDIPFTYSHTWQISFF